MYTIHNKLMTVTISPIGAEVQSVLDNKGREWMWQGDPDVWEYHAPVCFPFVARLRDCSYTYRGETYNIPIHGFARDLPFTCTEQSATTISFLLEANDFTREQYPFEFSLEITYSLKGQILEKSHKVSNKGTDVMWYELGGHDGYAMGFTPEEDFHKCSLEIPGVTELSAYLSDENIMMTPKKKDIPMKDGRFSLDHNANGCGSYPLEKLPQRGISLLDQEGNVKLRVAFPDFDHLTLWSADPSRFFCIEPWTSLPDCTFVGRDSKEKYNVRCLEAGASEVLAFATEFVI